MVSSLWIKILIILSFIVLCSSRYRQDYSNSEPNACTQCMNNRTCISPDCFCCRDEFKLPISIRDIPQIVFFTFDDALTDSATKFYKQLFNESRKNPNGCPVSMTLFVSHHDTVYKNVNQMYRKGMEIAAHSVSHAHMSNDNFMTEAKNQKRNLATLGGVPENEIVGWRSPFLEPVGDMQPDTLKKLGYSYDATLTYSKRSINDKAPAPFTLDFGWPYDCKVKPCPKRRHFGFWEVPVVSLLDYLHQYDCVYVDGCNNPPPDESSAFKFLMDNFKSYYSKYRIPFGINMHPSWFYIPERLNAMDRFIKHLSNMDDVFIVSVKKMLEWLKNPTGLSQIHNFKPWQCQSQRTSKRLQQNRGNWNRQPDPITLRRSHIQARLQQIHEMRRKQQEALSREYKRLHQSPDSRNKLWTQTSGRHTPHRVKQDKPSAIAPWVHRKHDRPVKQNARIPAMATYLKPSSKEVPFWKRKNSGVSKTSNIKQNQDVAWWEKAIPNTKAAKVLRNEEKPTKKGDTRKQESVKKIIDIKSLRNVFNTNTNTNIQLKNVHVRKNTVNIKNVPPNNIEEQNEEIPQEQVKSGTSVDAPPRVDFKKQLKDQELKQLEIIEKQKKEQELQLKMQIKQLEENNRRVFKKQQEEEAKRMEEIEKRHMMAVNKQQPPLKTVELSDHSIHQSQDVELTTVLPQHQQVGTIPQNREKFSLFPNKNSKADPWTQFVHFIIRNKP